jgi:hypothetical protein
MGTARWAALVIMISSAMAIPVLAVSPRTLKSKIDKRCGEACQEIARIRDEGVANPARRAECLTKLDRLQADLRKSRERANRIKSKYNDQDQAEVDVQLAESRARINHDFDSARQALGAPANTVPPPDTYRQSSNSRQPTYQQLNSYGQPIN